MKLLASIFTGFLPEINYKVQDPFKQEKNSWKTEFGDKKIEPEVRQLILFAVNLISVK